MPRRGISPNTTPATSFPPGSGVFMLLFLLVGFGSLPFLPRASLRVGFPAADLFVAAFFSSFLPHVCVFLSCLITVCRLD